MKKQPNHIWLYLIIVSFSSLIYAQKDNSNYFDIVTKKPNEDRWIKFSNREPIEVKISENNEPVNFVTPMFTAEISHPKNNFLEAKVVSISDQSVFGFKRSLNANNLRGYKPAYQVTGYR